MSKTREIPWVIEEHTKIKHQLLSDYLGVWLPIMYSQQSLIGKDKKLVYVDGFAGPGEYWSDSKKNSKVNGSPVIAAEKANIYIDQDKTRKFLIIAIDCNKRCVDNLQPILQQINRHNQSWHVLHTTFEQGMDELFSYLEKNHANIAPAFFFIDPFGYSGFTMDTMVRILKQPRTELFINFMHYDINRFLEAGHSQEHLEALFGCDEYKNAANLNSDEKTSYLIDLYCKKLKHKSNGIYILPFRMNTPGQGRRPRYFLVHVSQHIKALKAMKDRMAKASSQSFRFEAVGISSCRQLDLFEPSDEEVLKGKVFEIITRYQEKNMLYDNLEDWAYQETSGIAREIKNALVILENEGKILIKRKTRQRINTVNYGAFIQLKK